jgi:hypothetical protein
MVNTSMKNMKLPEQIQLDIRDFMFATQNLLEYQKETSLFLELLSPSLKSHVM